jgi:hypothetical protein
MAILKLKNTQGEWQSIPAFKGDPGKDGVDGYTPVKGVDYFDGKDGVDGKDGLDGKPGKDGAIQYNAGEGVKIENNTISAEVTKQYVTDSITEAIQTTLGGSY